MAGKLIELFDASLDIVAGHPLPSGDGVKVDLVHRSLIVSYRRKRNVDPQGFLSPHDRQPQLPLQLDFVRR